MDVGTRGAGSLKLRNKLFIAILSVLRPKDTQQLSGLHLVTFEHNVLHMKGI